LCYSSAKVSQKQQLAAVQTKGCKILAEKHAVQASETASEDLWNELQTANLCIQELELYLAQKIAECTNLQSELEKANKRLAKHHADSNFWKSKHEGTYCELRLQRQTAKQKQEKADKLEQQMEILKKAGGFFSILERSQAV